MTLAGTLEERFTNWGHINISNLYAESVVLSLSNSDNEFGNSKNEFEVEEVEENELIFLLLLDSLYLESHIYNITKSQE